MQPPIDRIIEADLPLIFHRGPPLIEGIKPSILYFSLSGEESLELDPFNQPVVFLANKGIRVFSITLPAHEGTFPHKHALAEWAKRLEAGHNLIGDFVDTCRRVIDHLIDRAYIDPHHLGVAGLSRGGFMATHLAARDERIATILGFAPPVSLETMKDFQHIGPNAWISSFSLENLIPDLLSKTIRFYIGNCDTLVDTPRCFSFIHSLSAAIHQHKRKSPPVELVIHPSIGHKGHGTPPEIFEAGAAWIKAKIG